MNRHLLNKESAIKAMGITLQPHVIVICDDVNQLDAVGGSVSFAVIQSNLYYELPSVVAAVDTCVKVCFVMNLRYPAAARSSWLFIQRAVFDIVTNADDAACKVLQLLADCNRDG
jgi:hypothetical protein